MSHQPSRRDLLKTAAAAIAALILPRSLFARNPDKSFFFLHADIGNSWPVANPVAWALANRHEPILERASTGLAKLTENDGERVVRLIVRRCRLNLLELRPDQVVVHHWGQHQADLRPFFKQHRLAHSEIVVSLRERKHEITTTKPGDDFLFGSRIAADFPVNLFQGKFNNCFTQEADDLQAAPETSSGFAWDGLEDNRIPWAALKSAWRRAAPMICQNCDTATILTNFGLRQVGMLNRSPNFVSVCGACRRSFKDETVRDVQGWLEANLDAVVRPDFDMVWERRVRRESA